MPWRRHLRPKAKALVAVATHQRRSGLTRGGYVNIYIYIYTNDKSPKVEPGKHIGQPTDDELDNDPELWIYLEGKDEDDCTIAIPIMDLDLVPIDEVTLPAWPRRLRQLWVFEFPWLGYTQA